MVSHVAQTMKPIAATNPPSPVKVFTYVPRAEISSAADSVAYTFSRCFWTGTDLQIPDAIGLRETTFGRNIEQDLEAKTSQEARQCHTL